MPKQTETKSVADMQPDEITALRAIVKEFMDKVSALDNEVEQLKEDRKEIIEEYSDRLDMKTLQIALRVLKLQNNVAHKDSYDLFIEVLTDSSI
jgi:uncharacterized protein (UPF0335 family)